jgi:hypothetical protein
MNLKNFYIKYREYILFNKNILISGLVAFFGGAAFAQLYYAVDECDLSNSLVTLFVEYCIYIPLFGVLFYFDNKKKYKDLYSGKNDYRKIVSDIKKLVAAFSISELIFSISKVAIHYQLLQMSLVEPYQASMIGSIVAWIIFLVIINTSIKAVKLFRSK